MVKSYEEWVKAVEAETVKLRAAEQYLSEDGKERLFVFGSLLNLSSFCESAKELVEMIGATDDLSKEDLEALNSCHAEQPVWRLTKIGEEEN